MFLILSRRDMANRIGRSGSMKRPRWAESGLPKTSSRISSVSS
jgi:hypothetical protein